MASRMTGQDAVARRFRRMSSGVTDAVEDALVELGGQVRDEARLSIIEGSVSGPGHVPSAPGEPPNADTGHLDESIHVTSYVRGGTVTVEVSADAEYAADLEYGNSRIAERPFMRPATAKVRPRVPAGVRVAVRRLR